MQLKCVKKSTTYLIAKMDEKTHKKTRLSIVQRIYNQIYDKNDVPGEIRTPDPRLRRALLYPAELLGPIIFSDIFYYN